MLRHPPVDSTSQDSRARSRKESVEPLLEDLGPIDLRGIHWVIVGGESGHGARPMRAEWVRSIREQCDAAGVSFFFKQWGGVQKSRTGRLLDGQTYDAIPETKIEAIPQRRVRLALVDQLETNAANLAPIVA